MSGNSMIESIHLGRLPARTLDALAAQYLRDGGEPKDLGYTWSDSSDLLVRFAATKTCSQLCCIKGLGALGRAAVAVLAEKAGHRLPCGCGAQPCAAGMPRGKRVRRQWHSFAVVAGLL